MTERRILFNDEGNGKVLPGLFLHHYWGRKSPLLRKTAFETFMPTISLGIPLSEANVFTQFLLGLDWEITTGFEVNVGYHFGKVNALPGDSASAVSSQPSWTSRMSRRARSILLSTSASS